MALVGKVATPEGNWTLGGPGGFPKDVEGGLAPWNATVGTERAFVEGRKGVLGLCRSRKEVARRRCGDGAMCPGR